MRMPTRQLELPFTAPRQPLAPRSLPGTPASPRLPGRPALPSTPANAGWRGRVPAMPPAFILLRPQEGPTP